MGYLSSFDAHRRRVPKDEGAAYVLMISEKPTVPRDEKASKSAETSEHKELVNLREIIDVRFWHFSDIPSAPANVRYWG
jgi:hypothetical protein